MKDTEINQKMKNKNIPKWKKIPKEIHFMNSNDEPDQIEIESRMRSGNLDEKTVREIYKKAGNNLRVVGSLISEEIIKREKIIETNPEQMKKQKIETITQFLLELKDEKIARCFATSLVKSG